MDSGEVSVAQFLKPFAEKRETGALEASCGPYRGFLYIQNGILIQAEYLGKMGLSAAYDILDMKGSMMQWRAGVTPSSTGIAMDLTQLLEELETIKNAPPPAAPSADIFEAAEEPEEVVEVPAVLAEEQNKSSELLKQFFFSLEWLNSPEKSRPFEFENRDQTSYTVGSSSDCDFNLPHPGVQPLHFSLLVQADHVEIWDLGTDNSTFLNGQLIDQAVLSSGDVIQAGEAKLSFNLQVRRSGRIAKDEPEKEKKDLPAPRPVSERIRGPITAHSIVKTQSQSPGLRKMIGRFFNKKGK